MCNRDIQTRKFLVGDDLILEEPFSLHDAVVVDGAMLHVNGPEGSYDFIPFLCEMV